MLSALHGVANLGADIDTVAVKLFVIGATGATGTALVKQGLERGHQVTAFSRSPMKGFDGASALVSHVGDPMRTEELAAVLGGHDVVLSALGTRGLGGGGTTVLVDGVKATMTAMQTVKLRRLIIISSTLNDPNQPWLPRFLARTLLKHHAADQREMEKVIAATDVNWTVVRPPRLTNGALTKNYKVADEQITEGAAAMSREDVAHSMLDIAEQGGHARKVTWVRR